MILFVRLPKESMIAQAQTHFGGAWKAKLDLQFRLQGQRTTLVFKKHSGPLLVQRPFYANDDRACHLYIIHPPGGVAGGDILDIRANLEEKSRVLFTTPAAGKFYRSMGPYAQQKITLHVSGNSYCEYLPQETIFYDGAKVDLETRIHLSKDSQFIGWEICCFGLPASKEPFTKGRIRQRFEIWQDEKPISIERATYTPEAIQAEWGNRGNLIVGTLIATVPKQQSKDIVLPTPESSALFGGTSLEDVYLCRYMGHSAEEARNLFRDTWAILRRKCWKQEISEPRVWAT